MGVANAVPQKQVQQRTVEHIITFPVLQIVRERMSELIVELSVGVPMLQVLRESVEMEVEAVRWRA